MSETQEQEVVEECRNAVIVSQAEPEHTVLQDGSQVLHWKASLSEHVRWMCEGVSEEQLLAMGIDKEKLLTQQANDEPALRDALLKIYQHCAEQDVTAQQQPQVAPLLQTTLSEQPSTENCGEKPAL